MASDDDGDVPIRVDVRDPATARQLRYEEGNMALWCGTNPTPEP